MCVVHGHRGPLGPYVGRHTSWDPVVGSYIFVGPDAGLLWFVGSVVGFWSLSGLVGESLCLWGWGVETWGYSGPLGHLGDGVGPPRKGWCCLGISPKQRHPWTPRPVPFSTFDGYGTWATVPAMGSARSPFFAAISPPFLGVSAALGEVSCY